MNTMNAKEKMNAKENFKFACDMLLQLSQVRHYIVTDVQLNKDTRLSVDMYDGKVHLHCYGSEVADELRSKLNDFDYESPDKAIEDLNTAIAVSAEYERRKAGLLEEIAAGLAFHFNEKED